MREYSLWPRPLSSSKRLVRSDCGQSTSIAYLLCKATFYNKLCRSEAQKDMGLDGLLETMVYNPPNLA